MDAETIISNQLAAYNAKDLDLFMSFWAKDAQIYSFPDTEICSGHSAIRERHKIRFQEPDLHAALLHRLVLDDMVIDQEQVRRNLDTGIHKVPVIAIYQVKAHLIQRATFKMGQAEPV